MKLVTTLLATSIAVLGSSQVMAYEAGDIMIKAGVINVAPKDDSGIDGVKVKDDTQLGLTGTYMLTPQVGIEVLAATPFKHTIEAGGSRVATTKQLPPTVSAQYYPMDSNSALQPYIGAGLNTTLFFDEDDVVLEDSFGLSVSAGVNYDIDEHFMANVGVWYMDIDTKIKGYKTVEIDPIVIMAGAGYKF